MKAGKDGPLRMRFGNPRDNRQDPLHPRRMPGRILGEETLHVDAEMNRPLVSGP